MSAASRVRSEPVDRDGRPVTADEILEVAGNIVERHGVDALTMRRLSDDLGVAVTSVYWHVGNRDAVLDGLVDRLLDRMETIRAVGDTPVERVASLARELRSTLLERQHLVGLAHERDRSGVAGARHFVSAYGSCCCSKCQPRNGRSRSLASKFR